ncbi:MAG: zinc ribbon domain-containing protein [Blastocatellia bacterium]
MKFKTSDPNLHKESNAPDLSGDLNLYDDLLTFTELSPEEQTAQLSRQSSFEIPEVYQQPEFVPDEEHTTHTAVALPPQTNNPFFFEAAKDSAVDAIVKEPACEPPPQNKDASADIQMVDILRVTGPLADSSASHDLSSVCGDCGSLADSEDVFCITCGGPLEEVERAAPPSCSDCGLTIVSDEIFCPSCGSAMQDENGTLF